MFNKVVILIHDINDISSIYYWKLVHYVPYWLAYIIVKYYEIKGVQYTIRTDNSINYNINRRIL